MSFAAPLGSRRYGSVRAAGLYLSWFALGLPVPALLRTNNKAHQFAPSAPDGKTAARFRRRCAVRYCAAFANISRG